MKKIWGAYWLLLFIAQGAHAGISTKPITFIGTIPTKISRLIQVLRNHKFTERAINHKNCLLLYGPPGNGKTTLAHLVAQETKCMFLRLPGPTIVGKYVGDGAQRIKEMFNQARALCAEKKLVIVFIDEIDAIAAHNTSEMRTEHLAALQQLWLELDDCKNNPYVCVMFATNCIDKLHHAFLDRIGSNTIECPNPELEQRQALLEYFFNALSLDINPTLLNALAQKTDNFSIRCLEDLCCAICLARETYDSSISLETICTRELEALKNNYRYRDQQTKAESSCWQKASSILSTVHSSLAILLCLHSLYSIATSHHARGFNVLM